MKIVVKIDENYRPESETHKYIAKNASTKNEFYIENDEELIQLSAQTKPYTENAINNISRDKPQIFFLEGESNRVYNYQIRLNPQYKET